MYNIKITDYVPQPKPVSSDYFVCAHYYAAWKKGCAGLHDGFDDLHGYPERTPLAGYYDEGNPEYADWEIKWAVEHGINCFIHCWYRYKENVGKKITEEALRCAHGLHDGFFNSKYQSMMKFAIMFETSPRWGNTTPEDMLENLMPYWMENYFKRENYLIIDNKPVLFNFCWQELAKSLGTQKQQREVFDKCREYCKQHGFDGMIFASQEGLEYAKYHEELKERGYDFSFTYNIPYLGNHNPSESKMLEFIKKYYTERVALDPSSYITTASCFWDPEPRITQKWLDNGYDFGNSCSIWYHSPEYFREQLKNAKSITDSLPKDNVGRKIIMIDNWNEWDEGHFVAPSHKFGFGYLQAIREELTLCNNLPDYRMPQDIGLSRFNKSWGEPDFSEICRKKFDL